MIKYKFWKRFSQTLLSLQSPSNNFNFSQDFSGCHAGSMLILVSRVSLPQDNGKTLFPGVLFQEAAQLTSTSPVRSLYLSRMTGSAVFSLRVLDRSLKGCSRAGEGEDRLISLSPRLKLLLCDPGSGRTVDTKVLLLSLAGAGVCLLT